ncbi:Fur family transcriptional regulator [Halarcobacter sp.]|uniref:Fur family transcriptional regulator n=1 Tax=Halarcobacter sp. TaxID=2321133 RepID=UPI003A91BD7D
MDYQDLLKQYKLRVTPQRLSLLELIEKYQHIDIDTLFENIKILFPTISLSTLYKNINAMVENGLLTELKITGMKSKFEITKANHFHAICKKCGKIEELSFDVANVKNNLEKRTNYHITHTTMNFLGICLECRE